jgi:hypothetical protein
MKTELMRELFEAWYGREAKRNEFDSYINPWTEARWESFQAACNMFLNHVEIVPDDSCIAFIDGKYCIRESELKGGL